MKSPIITTTHHHHPSTMVKLALFSLLLASSSVNSFQLASHSKPAFASPSRLQVFQTSQDESSSFSKALPTILSSLLTTPSSSDGSTALTTLHHLPSTDPDPFIKAEMLNDLAHIALDMTTFMGPEKVAIRAASVVGRMMAMAADWLPDHWLNPEELVFQMAMLSLAVTGLFRAILPLYTAANHNVTVRDGKAFSILFGPAGMSWGQFKSLNAHCLDWVSVSAHHTLSNEEELEVGDEYMYWLYKGCVITEHKGKQVFNVTRTSGGASSLKKDAGRGLVGETKLLEELDKHDSVKKVPRTTVKVGDDGALLLRIHKPSLNALIECDHGLEKVMRRLVFQAMQEKLSAQLDA
jgi:hypothetical protein